MKIDLAGPNGNGLALLCIAHNAALQLGMNKEKAHDITRRMQSGNYNDLLNVMEEEFPWIFEFAHDPRSEKSNRAQ